MNEEHWRKLLPLITAFTEKKQIQARGPNTMWVNVPPGSPITFNEDPSCYRMAPEPREWTMSVALPGHPSHGPGRVISDDPPKEAYESYTWERVRVREIIEGVEP